MLQFLTRPVRQCCCCRRFDLAIFSIEYQHKKSSQLSIEQISVTGSLNQYRNLASASSFFRNSKRIESYFSAIGGESDDPPPDLTPEQVTAILRTNESLILNNKIASENEKFLQNFMDVLESKKLAKNKKFEALRQTRKNKNSGQQSEDGSFSGTSTVDKLYSFIDDAWVSQVESNQLASNHPIEDRIRVCSLKLPSGQSGVIFGVFDGHGGGFCADIIARRLFHYITIGLKSLNDNDKNVDQKNLQESLLTMATDHTKSPARFYHNINTMYEEDVANGLKARIEQFEWECLEKFAKENVEQEEGEVDDPIRSVLQRSFIRCDEDLSREIEQNLVDTTSNILLHYYHSLAVSGCCATVVLVYGNRVYVASSGDCRAVMGLLKGQSGKKHLRVIELSREHNADNVNELNRIYSEHPKEEHNFIIREHRLLGQLMPLRAFGDFPFKWSVDRMKQLGLTRAFGSHVIPTFYRTPPYLTAAPEITTLDLEQDHDQEQDERWIDRFIVIATDGLWEQFDSPRKVVKAVNRYRQNWYKQIKAYTSAQVFNIEPISKEVDHQQEKLTLGQIFTRLQEQVKEPPVTAFKPVTADDDLIEDINCGTFLLRTALSDISVLVPRPNTGRGPVGSIEDSLDSEEKFSHHMDQYEQQRRRHSKLVSYLTLPQTVVRNFRDDISLIVVGLK